MISFSAVLLIGFILIACAIAKTDVFAFIARDELEELERALENQPKLLNKKGPGGQTPLMNAVLSGKTKAVETLLRLGADVTIGEQDGYTPIHGAGFQGRADIARLLIDHGISPTDSHKDGFIPLHRACWGNEKRHTDTVRVFLDAGVPVDFKTADGKTCLDMTRNQRTRKLLESYSKRSSEL